MYRKFNLFENTNYEKLQFSLRFMKYLRKYQKFLELLKNCLSLNFKLNPERVNLI